MRLIDADALIKNLESDAEQMEEPIAKMFTYAAINDVKHAPTVDAVPVVHGQWIHYLGDGLRWKCSNCGSRYETPWHYCPNCLANMEVEHETD